MSLMLGYYCRPSRFLLLFLDIISTLMVVYVTSPEEVWALRPRGKPPPCSTELRATLTSFDLWSPTRFIYTSSGWRLAPRRGCRAGRRVQRQRATSPAACLHPSVSVSTSTAASNCVTFALLNVRSLNNKLDDVLEIMRDRSVDIFCITESWHDTDSACIGRLRSDGYNVVDRPRPRGDDDMSVDHGGVVVFSTADK